MTKNHVVRPVSHITAK